MRVEWVQRRRVQWVRETRAQLGVGLIGILEWEDPVEKNPSGAQLHAKNILWLWGKANPTYSPIAGYGTAADLTSNWMDRDRQMMSAFCNWWNITHPSQAIPISQNVTNANIKALDQWVKEENAKASQAQPITPGQFPPGSGQPQPQLTFPLLTLTPLGWPPGVPYPPPKPSWWPDGLNYPPVGDSWAPVPPGWWNLSPNPLPWPPPKPDGWPTFPYPLPPTALASVMSCDQVCDAQFGTKGTTPNQTALDVCKKGCSTAATPPPLTFPIGPQNLRPLPPDTGTAPSTGTTSTPKSSVVPIVLGLAALGGVAWLLMRGSGTTLLENPQFSFLGWTFGAHKTGRGKVKPPKMKLTKKGKKEFAAEWKRVFPTLPVPDIDEP